MPDHRNPYVLCRCGHPRLRHARCRCQDPGHGPRGCTEDGCSCQVFTLSAEGIEVQAAPADAQLCPDGGTCHHACPPRSCHRQEHGYGALTEDGTWPDPVEAALDRMRQLLVRPTGEPDPLAEGWLAAARDQQAGDRERQAVQLLTQAVLIAHQRTTSSACSCGELPLGTSWAEHVTRHLATEGVLRGRP